MFFKPPKNDSNYYWTQNATALMRKYGLSESRVRRVLGNYERKEAGIAPGTVAVAQTVGGKNKYEIWVMYENKAQKSKRKNENSTLRKKIIAAWKYPGRAPKGKPIEAPLA